MKDQAMQSEGEQKHIICFAFLPIRTDDGKKIWFERYLARCRYNHIGGKRYRWKKIGSWSRYSSEWKFVYKNMMKYKKLYEME